MATTKNYITQLGKIAVMRTKESPKGTAIATSSGGVTMDMDAGSMIKLDREIENNAEQIHGSELPTETYYGRHSASGSLAQEKVKPDFLAFILSFCLGACTSTAAGTTGYRHTITRLVNNPDHPAFTEQQQHGESIIKERFAGNHIQAVTIELGDGPWVSASADIVGWGNKDDNFVRETIATAANATTFELTEDVQGATAAERLESFFEARAKDEGSDLWEFPTVSEVSAADPAVVTITPAVGTGTGDIDFEVTYIEDEGDLAWCTFPAKISESPLKVTCCEVRLHGLWNGTSFSGGRAVPVDEFLGMSIAITNEITIHHGPDASCSLHATDSHREGIGIEITITKKMKDAIMQASMDKSDQENIAVRLLLQGAEIDVGGGFYFGGELIFPKCRLMSDEIGDAGKTKQEVPVLQVLDDGTYDGIVAIIYNQVSAYAV
jgi:hypothetical protein